MKKRSLIVALALALTVPASLLNCSSDSVHPPAAGLDDSGVPDHFVAPPPDTGPPDLGPPDLGPPDVGQGDGPNASAPVVAPTSLDFGAVKCGTQATSQAVTVKNPGSAAITFNAALTSGSSNYSVSPTSGTISPQSSQVVTITPNAIPQKSDVTPDLYAGTLNITTNFPNDTSHIVTLHETASGIILVSTAGGTIGFGGVSIGQTATANFSISNNGNAATTVSFTDGTSFFTVSPSFALPASSTVAPIVTFTPAAVQSYTDTIIMTVPATTGFCAPLPGNINLTGAGTTGVSINPTSLTFGNINCGSPAAPYQTITIGNTGGPMQFTLTLNKGVTSPYTLAFNGTGTPPTPAAGTPIMPGSPYNLNAGSNVTIRIIPNQITIPASTGQNGFGDSLVITTTSPSDVAHVVQLNETAQGTIFVLEPSSLTPSDTIPHHQKFNPFDVKNTGSLPAQFSLQVVTTKGCPNYGAPTCTGGDDSFVSNLSGGTLVGGSQTSGANLTTQWSGVSQDTGRIHLSTPSSTVLCSDLPPDMPISIN